MSCAVQVQKYCRNRIVGKNFERGDVFEEARGGPDKVRYAATQGKLNECVFYLHTLAVDRLLLWSCVMCKEKFNISCSCQWDSSLGSQHGRDSDTAL